MKYARRVGVTMQTFDCEEELHKIQNLWNRGAVSKLLFFSRRQMRTRMSAIGARLLPA